MVTLSIDSSIQLSPSNHHIVYISLVFLLCWSTSIIPVVRGLSLSDSIPHSTITMKPVVGTASQANKKKLVVHWFRLGDMRLHDNPALHESIRQAGNDNILPVFCFDPRIFGNSARSRLPNQNELKCGPKRAQFVLESVMDLRANLERKGSGLIVAHAKPEDFIPQLFQTIGTVALAEGKVICQEEVCSEEQSVVKALQKSLQQVCGGNRPKSSLIETIWGSTLYNLQDLPYKPGLTDLPDTVSEPDRQNTSRNFVLMETHN